MSKNKQIRLFCIFLTIATLLVFWQVNNCDFINYDDTIYITKNNHVQNGITIEGIQWAFTTGHTGNWHPLTWLSHMLDVQLFGLEPGWHHLTNLVFHIANALLLFLVLYRMTKAQWESAFVAALFALHPLHVESVAWVAERKDVLSTFFWILTMGAYCYYVERPNFQRYLVVVLFFALGLMAKPMLVTLPFVLLLLDYWPLKRFYQNKSDQKIDTATDSRHRLALIRPLLWEKIPLFVLTALTCIVTYIVQKKIGAVLSLLPLGARISNAFVSYNAYIGKTIWPNDLAVLYPYPALLPAWQAVGAAFLLIVVTIAVIWKARKMPYVMVGWLWYAGTLVPVIGIVQVGLQARADRYTYLPLIGLFIMATWGISELSKKWRYRKKVLFTLSTVILLCLSIVTWTQIPYWKNSITLNEHALNVTADNYIAYNNCGTAYLNLGNYRQAIVDYNKAIEIRPKYTDAYYNRGISYWHLGNKMQAIRDFDSAIEINPNYAEIYYGRGNVYAALGNYRQAIRDFDKAIEINPKYAGIYYNRGNVYVALGNYGQAIDDMKTAARLGQKNAQDLLKSKEIDW
jgi:tetratricopeptide (TPR) repeat protein